MSIHKIEELYKYGYTRLQDILVPLDVVEKQIRAIEGIYNFKFVVHNPVSGKVIPNSERYTIPYPYISGIRDKYPELYNSLEANDDYAHEFREMFDERIFPYHTFTFPKDYIFNVDNNPNVCTILNMVNGSLGAFDRTKVRALVPLTIPYNLPTMVYNLRAITQARETGDFSKVLQGMIREDDDTDETIENYLNYISGAAIQSGLAEPEYMITYQLVRSEKTPDKFLYDGKNQDCIYATGMINAIRSSKECFKINRNTLDLYEKKSKVILVK